MKTLTNQGAFNENFLRFDYTVDPLLVEKLLLQTAQFVNNRIALKLITRYIKTSALQDHNRPGQHCKTDVCPHLAGTD